MLNKRYQNDGKPVVPLLGSQKEMKRMVDEKIKKGIYKFEKVDCCICGGANFELLSYKDRFGIYSPVVICKDCGLIQTNPRMNKESYNLFYNNEYVQLDRLCSYGGEERTSDEIFESQYRRGASITAFLEKAKALKKPLKEIFVLEIGCSFGGILKYFYDQECKVKGVDLEKNQVVYGREKYGLDLSQGTISDIGPNEQPDIIIYSHIFEHLLSPSEELIKIKKALGKNGILCILAPDMGDLKDGYTLFDVLRIAHTYHFTLRTLTNLLNKNGWERIAGRNGLIALFQVKNNGSKEIMNDYEDIMEFINKTEKGMSFNKSLWYLKHSPRLLTGYLLGIIGLCRTVSKFTRKVKKSKI